MCTANSMLHQELNVEEILNNFVVAADLSSACVQMVHCSGPSKLKSSENKLKQPVNDDSHKFKRSIRPQKTNVKIVMIVQCTENQHIRILVQRTAQLEAIFSNNSNHICVLQVPPDTIMFQSEVCLVT